MLLNTFQTGMGLIGDYKELIIAGVLLIVIFIVLKVGLVIVKAQIRTNMKWVGYSFLIQVGTTFVIGSPLMLLGFAGVFQGDPVAIIPVVVIAFIIDLQVVNVIHQIGLKRSLVVVSLIILPLIFSMYFLGNFIGKL